LLAFTFTATKLFKFRPYKITVGLGESLAPYFPTKLNSDRYDNDVLNPFFNQLTAEERQYGYFQQDNATGHTANSAMVAIRGEFEGRIINRDTGLPNPQISVFAIFIIGET
jgi:hypothetical protein